MEICLGPPSHKEYSHPSSSSQFPHSPFFPLLASIPAESKIFTMVVFSSSSVDNTSHYYLFAFTWEGQHT